MGTEFLTDPIVVAILIPGILLLAGGVAKKLVRGSSFKREDFFLGVEFTLAALTSAIVYVYDLVKAGPTSSPTQYMSTSTFIGVSIFLLLYVLAIHQEWEAKATSPRWRVFWLGFMANGIGAGLLVSFVLFVKGLR